jgi:mRNA interferase RelE/StbE
MLSIVYEAAAWRDIERLPRNIQERVVAAIEDLAFDPRPAAAHPLTGAGRAYTLRIGSYRAIYEVEHDAGQVVIYRVGNRRDIYLRTREQRAQIYLRGRLFLFFLIERLRCRHAFGGLVHAAH